jgi:hypothetical protein
MGDSRPIIAKADHDKIAFHRGRDVDFGVRSPFERPLAIAGQVHEDL